MTQLKQLDGLAKEVLSIRASDMGPARRRHAEDSLIFKMANLLAPTTRKMMRRKAMVELQDEVEQHAGIAIHSALSDWDGEISSFSTHVHWKLRAELRTLELQHYPERRKVCENIDVQMLYLNETCKDGQDGKSDEVGEVMNLDPEGYRSIEDNVDHAMFTRNIDNALSKIAMQRINAYIRGGCIDRTPVETIMRDIHIFIQRALHEKSSNDVAICHGITRERIRQINEKVSEGFEKNIRDLMAKPRTMNKDEERLWNLALAIYHEEKGYDIKLIDRGCNKTAEQLENEILSSQDEEMKPELVATLAATALIASPAASQTKSRAIKPEDNKVTVTVVEDPQMVNKQDKQAVNEDMGPQLEKDGRVEWAIKVGEHPTRYAVRLAANDVLNRNPELKAYKTAMIPSRHGKGIGLAFGALDLSRATRLCEVLTSRGENCERIRLGNR